MSKTTLCLVLFFFALTSGCKNRENPVIPPQVNDNFGIYFLQDSTLKMNDIPLMDLSQVKLQNVPFLSDKDIVSYDWSSHCIYLQEDKNNFFHFDLPFYEFSLSWANRPFVLVANGKKCYIGYFVSIISSDRWPYPDILDVDFNYYPSDIVHIEWPFLFAKDERNNEEIKSTFRELNLLHEGLRITIDSLWIDNADTSTARYKITIRNIDTDNLYVLDSDKMGAPLFHAFTNGPVFYNPSNNTVYSSIYKKVTLPKPINSYESKWFTKIENGKSITRMISLKGYPHLPSSDYYCEFEFSNPTLISKNDRTLSDGRYWIGSTKSELIGFHWIDSGKVNSKVRQLELLNNPAINKYMH